MATCYACVGLGANHTCPKTTRPTFRVWWGESGESIGDGEESYGRVYGHEEIDSAVEEHAAYFHYHQEGYESWWPVTFFVRDLSTGKVFELEVERDFDPVFSACTPAEVDVDARKIADWWDAFIRMWKPVGGCLLRAPAAYAGHWREFHRGHGCQQDPARS